MNRNLLVNLLLLVGIFHFANSENPDPLGLLYHDEANNSSPPIEDKFLLRTYDSDSADKNFNKRRTVYKETDDRDLNSSDNSDKYSESHEYVTRRKSNYGENEGKGYDKYREDYRDNERNKFSYSSGFDHSGDEGTRSIQLYKEQTNLKPRYEWENREHVFEDKQQMINEGRSSNRYSKDFVVMGDVNEYDRRGSVMDPREMKKPKNLNNDNDLLRTTHSAYPFLPKMNGYNGLHGTEYYNPDKGLIINFNTECPVTTPGKHRYMQKFILAPKPHINTHTEMSSFHMPESTIITSSNPYYYSY